MRSCASRTGAAQWPPSGTSVRRRPPVANVPLTDAVTDPTLGGLTILSSPQRRQIQVVVDIEQKIESALVRRIRMKDVIAVVEKDAQPPCSS